jgi:spore maturation protein CgeB
MLAYGQMSMCSRVYERAIGGAPHGDSLRSRNISKEDDVRIGVIGHVSPDYFADNVVDALHRMGHDVTHLGSARPRYGRRLSDWTATAIRGALPSVDERLQHRIVRAAMNACCEIVISLDALLMPEIVAELGKLGARLAFWFPDHVANMGRQLMLLAPYDALFFKEPHVVERVRSNLGLPAYYLPEACNPRWHRPLTAAGAEPYIVIAGNMYPSRVRLLERLVTKGIPLRLYGTAFPRWIGETPLRQIHTGRCIFREDKARVFRSAAGVLNTLHPGEISGVNARLFEAAGCGAAVVTEFRPAVEKLFSVGTEVLTFDDFDSLVEQVGRLLNEDGLTATLGNAAARRAHGEHTYERRLCSIIERLS